LLGNLACLLLFLSFYGESRFGRWRPIVYLGKISYGLYVFHWAMILIVRRLTNPGLVKGSLGAAILPLAQLILAFGLTVAVAIISYRFFEAPILRYKRRFELVATRPV
jgi:peptidoglycan/LPS O-acetylase OafA/YrhL